jgi:hypothetical protein
MSKILTDTFYKGLIYVLSIACLMLIFEVGFFGIVVQEQERKTIRKEAKKLGGLLDTSSVPNIVTEKINSLFDTSIARDEILHKKINDCMISFIIVIVIFIFIIISFCYNSIKSNPKDIAPIVSVAVLTVIILSLFQITMYFYAHKYIYTNDFKLNDDIMTYISDRV